MSLKEINRVKLEIKRLQVEVERLKKIESAAYAYKLSCAFSGYDYITPASAIDLKQATFFRQLTLFSLLSDIPSVAWGTVKVSPEIVHFWFDRDVLPNGSIGTGTFSLCGILFFEEKEIDVVKNTAGRTVCKRCHKAFQKQYTPQVLNNG
jgi:hypothetical protein